MKIVKLEWDDAMSLRDGTLEEVMSMSSMMTTYGELVLQDDDYYVIKMHDRGDSADFMRIPAKLIQKVTELK